jgi:Endonuclease NucS C-terminal domain
VATYICSLAAGLPENYEIGLRAHTWGVVDAYADKARQVQPGDLLFLYVAGSFRSLHEVTGGYFFDETPLWPEHNGSLFPHRIKISDPIAAGNVPITAAAPHISFMREMQVPTGTLQGANGVFNRRLTAEDVAYLRSRMTDRLPARAPVAAAVAEEFAERNRLIFQLYKHDLDDRIMQLLAANEIIVPADGRRIPTGIDVIDAVGTDRQGRLVVVDINRGQAPEQALLQVLRHMSWARQKRADRRDVRGLIVAEAADNALVELVSEVPNVDIQLFRLTLEFLPPPVLPPKAAAC